MTLLDLLSCHILLLRIFQVLLAGITGALAGAISMGLSEYIGLPLLVASRSRAGECFFFNCFAATKSQREVTLGDLKLEKEHFKFHRDVELAQVCLRVDCCGRSQQQRFAFS